VSCAQLDHKSTRTPSSVGDDSVWVAKTDKWTVSDEKSYRSWIRDGISDEIFLPDGEWAGVRTDGADLPYVLRAIYAYENEFHFRVKIFSRRHGLSNKTSKYKDVQSGKARMKNFLKDLVNSVSSHSIINSTADFTDLKNQRSLSSGDLIVLKYPKGISNHVIVVSDVISNEDGESLEIKTIQSTLPQKARKIFRDSVVGDLKDIYSGAEEVFFYRFK